MEAAVSSQVGALAPPLIRHRIPVALMAAVAASLAAAAAGSAAKAAVGAFIATVLIVVAATDLERRVIPNVVVLPATAVVVLARIALTPAHAPEWVLASLAAASAFLVPNLFNRAAMGMGDVKLALFLGAALGWGVVGAIVIAFLSVFPIAVGTLIRGGRDAGKSTLPFGPFLAFGGLVILIVPRLIGAA